MLISYTSDFRQSRIGVMMNFKKSIGNFSFLPWINATCMYYIKGYLGRNPWYQTINRQKIIKNRCMMYSNTNFI